MISKIKVLYKKFAPAILLVILAYTGYKNRAVILSKLGMSKPAA